MFDDRNIKARKALMSSMTLLVALSGCRGNTVSPVAPSPATFTAPTQVTRWTVTYTPVSLTGAACGISIGSDAGSGPMMVTLTPQTVDFKPGDPQYWEPYDFYEYTGPRTGASFIARQTYPAYTLPCGTVTWETTVTGTFSNDESHLTAQQVTTFNAGDAQVVTIYSWSGDRQCDGNSPNCLIPLPR
jgi:hypothetical protein